MKFLLKHIRLIIFASSAVTALTLYLIVMTIIPQGQLQIIKLTQWYALLALSLLYLTLLPSPLYTVFSTFPFKGLYVKARRALGVSAFGFALLHASFAFFGQLGGFNGLGFLSNRYLLAISLSFTALCILTILAATSFNKAVALLGSQKWKKLHRLVYIAGILILIHALMLGTHFENLNGRIPFFFFTGIFVLLILEAIRLDLYLSKTFPDVTHLGPVLAVTATICVLVSFYFILPAATTSSFNIHSLHIQIAKEAQQQNNQSNNQFTIPSLRGDRTRRFTASFYHPDSVQPNTNVQLSFQIFDANSGNQIFLFDQPYGKVMHLIIVDNELKYFVHIHPEYKDKVFSITTQFPKNGIYHLYIDFQPLGAIEQQFGFTLTVGDISNLKAPDPALDEDLSKTFGSYKITMLTPLPLNAAQLSVGNQTLTFSVYDAKTNKPVTTLKPYLQAFGHLVMINEKTFDYLHVHPTNITIPPPDSNSGPKVEFLPLGLYGPIKPGIYRVFAQFNPDNNLTVADYTIKVE